MPISTLPLQFPIWGILLRSSVPVYLAIFPVAGVPLRELGLSWKEGLTTSKEGGIPFPESPSLGAENGNIHAPPPTSETQAQPLSWQLQSIGAPATLVPGEGELPSGGGRGGGEALFKILHLMDPD